MIRSPFIFALTLALSISTLNASSKDSEEAPQIKSHAYACPQELQVEMPGGLRIYCDLYRPQSILDSDRNVRRIRTFLTFLGEHVLQELQEMDQLPWALLENQENTILQTAVKEMRRQQSSSQKLRGIILTNRNLDMERVFSQVEPTNDQGTALRVLIGMPGVFGGFSFLLPKKQEEVRRRLFQTFTHIIPSKEGLTELHD